MRLHNPMQINKSCRYKTILTAGAVGYHETVKEKYLILSSQFGFRPGLSTEYEFHPLPQADCTVLYS